MEWVSNYSHVHSVYTFTILLFITRVGRALRTVFALLMMFINESLIRQIHIDSHLPPPPSLLVASLIRPMAICIGFLDDFAN